MNYVYVQYFRPAGQSFPSFGVLRDTDIDLTVFKPLNASRSGIPIYFKDES
jgi:hypothetical protein